jgi:hypothetical protein
MLAKVWKLITLLALLLMPFGMTAAPASAHQSMAAGMPTEHCPDQGSNHGAKGGFAECTMACAAALPTADFASQGPLLIVCQPIQPAAALQLHGLHPDTATPPPKHS